MAPLYTSLAEIGLHTPLMYYLGQKFQLFNEDGEVFAGIIENIGIDMKTDGGCSVCIIPRGGGWEITASLFRIENSKYRWMLRNCRSSANDSTMVRFALYVL